MTWGGRVAPSQSSVSDLSQLGPRTEERETFTRLLGHPSEGHLEGVLNEPRPRRSQEASRSPRSTH